MSRQGFYTSQKTEYQSEPSPAGCPNQRDSLPGFFRSRREVNHIIRTTQEKSLRFSQEEMEIARETDLPDLLEYLGYSVKRVGRYYTTREMDSIRIKNRRTWTRYSTRQHGDAITFLEVFCDKSFEEAVAFLLDYHGRTRDSPSRHHAKPVPEERQAFSLPPAWYDSRRVRAYRKMLSEIKEEAPLGEGINYPYSTEEAAEYLPRLCAKYDVSATRMQKQS